MSDTTPHVADLADDFVHDLLPAWRAAEVERHCAECEPCRTAVEEARRRLAALKAVPPVETPPQLVETTVAAVEGHTRTRRLRVKRFFKWMTAAVAAAVVVMGALNIYYFTLSPTPYDLVVLGQSELLVTSMSSMRVRLMDRKANRPVEGVPVTVALRAINDPKGPWIEPLGSYRTDENGDVQPRFYVGDYPPGEYDLVVHADVAGSSEVVTRRVTLKRSWRLLLTSDKPVYQPGQTIHMRALALRHPAGKPVGKEAATFTVSDPKGNVVFKHEGETSAYGITATDCPLADELIEGTYTLICRVGDTESRMAVSVSKYVLPKIKLAVELDKSYYQPADRAKCTVRADYFFGKPVADAEARLEVRGNGQLLPPETGTVVRTDSRGGAVFELTLADLWKRLPGVETKLSFRVTVTDGAGQKQSSEVERIVTERPVRIEVIAEGGTLVRGVKNKVYLLTTTADGRPVSTRLRLTGGVQWDVQTNDLGLATFTIDPREEWIQWTTTAVGPNDAVLAERTNTLRCGEEQSDFLLRTDRAVYQGGDAMKVSALGGGDEPVCVDFFKTDGVRRMVLSETIGMRKGRGEQAIDLPPDLTGTLLVSAYRVGADGSRVGKARVVYVQPPDQLRVGMAPASGAKEYRPRAAEKVRLTLTDAAGKPAVGALSLSAVDEAVFSVPGAAERALPNSGLDRGLLRPVYALYSWSPDLARRLGKEDVNDLEQALFATTAGDTPRDGAGHPGRVALQYPSVIHTLDAETYTAKVQSVSDRREWGLDALQQAWVVLLVAVLVILYLSAWAFADTSSVIKFHQGALMVLGAVTFLYLVTFLHRPDASNTFSYVSTQVKGSPSRDFDDKKSSDKKESRKDDKKDDKKDDGRDWDRKVVHRDPVAVPDDQRWPSNLKDPAGAEDVLFVREAFPETLLWQPQVITDDDGKASVDLTFADAITTWRLAATAVDAEGRLGTGELPLRVVRPFFVDFNLPVSLTRNDEVTVPVVVHNYTDRPQTVTLTLSDADWFKLGGGPDQPLVVAPNKAVAAYYRLTAKRAGTFTLEVRADGQGVADALKRKIDIVPDGRRHEQVENGSLDRPAALTLTVPTQVIDGSLRAWVKVYPSGFSQLLEGLDGIFRLPSGCFEQTSSTLYPNVLALDYLKRTGQSKPEVEKQARHYIQVGYQRLLGFEVPGGGFDWYGRAPANQALTAYGLMEFEDMARVHAVDPNLIERTRRWLLSKRQIDGSWRADGHGRGADSPLTATAYIAWAVFDGGAAADDARRTLDYLLSHRSADIKDPYTLALVCNALLSLDVTGTWAGPYLDRLEALKQKSETGSFAWWQRRADERTLFQGAGPGADVETTALSVLALTRAKRPGFGSALAWLTSKKDAYGTWGSTQATVLSLKALLAGTRLADGGEKDRVITVKLGDRELPPIRIPKQQSEVVQRLDLAPHLAAGTQTLTLTETTGTASGYQVTLRYNVEDATAPRPADGFFDVELTHDRTEVAVLGTVGVKARVVNRKPDPAAMVMLDLPVPPGFVPLTDDLEALQRDDKVAKFSVEPRKIIVYLRELRREQPLEVAYRLQAVQPVKAMSPGARVYEYYAPEREAKTAPVLMTVKER
jgi:hypothetical protein